jgi:activating signal cointegrator complex subunit 3
VRLSETGKYIVAPQFAKQKDEQYWIIVGHEATGELVAMKRLNRLWKRSSVTLKFDWDDEWIEDAGLQSGDAVELQVYVVCDSFIGLNQQYGFKVDGKLK